MNIVILFQGVISFSWGLFIALLGVVIVRVSRKQSAKWLILLLSAVFLFAMSISILRTGFVFVGPNERAVVISPYAFRAPMGYLDEALSPGLRWIVPGEAARIYPVSKQTYIASAEGQSTSIQARTKDEQEVFVDVSVVYQIDAAKVVQLHIEWTNRYQDEFVRPMTQIAIQDAVALHGVNEILNTEYNSLENEIIEVIKERFAENNLILVDFVLHDIYLR